MTLKLLIITIFFSTIVSVAQADSGNIDLLLSNLDEVINNEKEYIARKEEYLNKLKEQLSDPLLVKENECFIYISLAREYETYQCDSAIVYSRKTISKANEISNVNWLNDGKIQWARSEAKAGMFTDAVEILNGINSRDLSHRQLVNYYKAYIESYIFWIEYQDGYKLDRLVENRNLYQDSLFRIVERNTFDYVSYLGQRYISCGDFDSAEKILTDFISSAVPDSREMASLASVLSHVYFEKGDYDKQKENLVISAIADVKSCIKENISLRALAVILFQEGDVKRANRYIKQSLDDANFYNARLRNIQTSKVLPIIDKAYQLDREKQQSKLSTMLIMISVLSVILIAAVIFVAAQMKKISHANRYIENANSQLKQLNVNLHDANMEQKQINAHLAEANHIKEQFIGSFLDICTEYIEKLRAFKSIVNRKAKAGQVNDLLRLTSNTEGSAQELKELYANFDRAFLNIYPTFVEEFNMFLRKEERYPVNDDGSLNHELRIFALIRLGIKDTNKISVFLNYTPRTVYNYRSKVKSKALDSYEEFEECVKKIGSDAF